MAVQLYVGTERGAVTLREGKRGKWVETYRTLPNRHVAAIDYNYLDVAERLRRLI